MSDVAWHVPHILRLGLLGLCALLASAALAFHPAASYSEVMAEEGEVKVVAIMRHLPPGDCRHAEKMMWGAGGQCPKAALAKLIIECSGEAVHVQRSAYGDLSNVKSVRVTRDAAEGGHAVVIRGGEADYGYVATLEMLSFHGPLGSHDDSDISMVSRRTVALASSPDSFKERTEYALDVKVESARASCGS